MDTDDSPDAGEGPDHPEDGDAFSWLADAFAAGDAEGVRALLQRRPDLRARVDEPLCAFDTPPLVHAAGRGDLAMVEVLLEAGADPDRRSDWWAGGFHALHSARGRVADRLLAAGATPDACAASNLDRIDLLEDLLDNDPECVHERGGDGQTPLHFARSREVVDLLLERGADPDARDVDHRSTAAEWMVGAGPDARTDLAVHLVDRGAAADVFLAAALGRVDRLRHLVTEDLERLNVRTGQGPYGEKPPSSFHIYTWTLGQHLSPLEVAARFQQAEAVDFLRSHADPAERFRAACASADGDEARRLLRDHPELADVMRGPSARLLPDAAWAANAPAVELMLSLGFDPEARGQDGGTALHCAAWMGSVDAVRSLLRHTGDALLERPDPTHGSTPLGWCCHGARHGRHPDGDYPAVARILLDAGAKPGPNLRDAPREVRAVIDEHVAGGG